MFHSMWCYSRTAQIFQVNIFFEPQQGKGARGLLLVRFFSQKLCKQRKLLYRRVAAGAGRVSAE